jgi:PAS domain-containing protein
MKESRDNKLKDLIGLAVDGMGVAVSIIDAKGTLLYYNQRAAKILDRRPEYLGSDIHSHHTKAASNEKLDRMLAEFQKGRADPFIYEANPYGKTIQVTLSPIFEDGRFIGCSQLVQLNEE